MTARTQLMDLPDEILSEILIHVPYDHIQWPKLRFVNCTFQSILSRSSFERKAAVNQFYNVYHLLPSDYLGGQPLLNCKISSDHYQAAFQPNSNITEKARDFVELGFTLARVIPLRVSLIPFDYATQDRCMNYHLDQMRIAVYVLRLLRLLPSGVEALLRYSALRSYEGYYLECASRFLDAEQHESKYKVEMLREVHRFLDFEYSFTHSGDAAWLLDRHDWPSEMEEIQTPITQPPKPELLAEKTGKYLPNMAMVSGAFHHLTFTRYRHTSHAYQNLYGSTFFDARTEATQQLTLTQQLCEQLEMEDGKQIDQLLKDLDTKVLAPIMAEQEEFMAEMNSVEQLQECLSNEIKLLMT